MYLYGASIKGIHEFITSTNKLKEIVGASLLLQDLEKILIKKDYCTKDQILVSAAANMKALLREDQAKKVVKEIPKKVMKKAYGVTFVQALVKIEGDKPKQEDFDELEKRLSIQRNRPSPPLDMALAVMKRAPRTGRPAVKKKVNKKDGSEDLLDRASIQKGEMYTEYFRKNAEERQFTDIEQLSNDKNKIGIIHADGNGLGQIIPAIVKNGEGENVLREFSTKLDKATREAFKEALECVKSKKIRKLMLSGDDMMAIVDPDYMLPFAYAYLQAFEEKTAANLKEYLEKIDKSKLTACAGIIFCNEKYPMHHAVRLAEGLNEEVKKIVKNTHRDKSEVPSALAFENVLSGLALKKEAVINRKIESPTKKVKTFFAPYYLDKHYGASIDEFLRLFELYTDVDKESTSPLPKLRNWLTLLGQDYTYAQLVLNRINEIAESKWKEKSEAEDILNNMGIDPKTMLDKNDRTVIFDILTINSVKGNG